MGPEERQLAAEGSSCFSQCEKHRHLCHSFVSLTQKQKITCPRRPKHNGTVVTTVDGSEILLAELLIWWKYHCLHPWWFHWGFLNHQPLSPWLIFSSVNLTVWKFLKPNGTGAGCCDSKSIRPMNFRVQTSEITRTTPKKTAKFSSWKLSHTGMSMVLSNWIITPL